MTVDAAREGRKDAGSTPATSTMITKDLQNFYKIPTLFLSKKSLGYAGP